MEKPKTKSEVRLEAFRERAQKAKELGDSALRAIDSVMAEEAELKAALQKGVDMGNLTEDEMTERLGEFHQARTSNPDKPS